MPSLIGVAGADGQISSGAAANYLITTPTSKFGTRELAVIVLEVTDLDVDWQDQDSTFTRAVRGIQQNVEVYTVFEPSGNFCTLLVATDTMPQDDGDTAGDGGSNGYLQDALDVAGISGTVWNASLTGSNINYD